jgi:putative oxidoreductase
MKVGLHSGLTEPMARFFNRTVGSTDFGLLVLRLAIGSMMFVHGYGKILKILSGSWKFPDPIGIGSSPSLFLTATAESVCMVLIVLGFKTRLAAFPPLIVMSVAALIVHSGDPWGDKELAVLYAAMFFVLVITGGGNISLDSAHRERRSRPPLR